MKRIHFPLLIAFFVLLSWVIGFTVGRRTQVVNPTVFSSGLIHKGNADQRLLIHTTYDETAYTSISPENLGWNYGNTITYSDVKDVIIVLNGNHKPLENAIYDGDITVEEIIAYARLDSKNGFCYEIPRTQNGFTYMIYRYPYFDLWTAHDVYETPDSKQHLISDFAISATGNSVSFFHENDGSNFPIDYEDWGITFDVVQADSGSITLSCTQSGGQHIGSLFLDYYSLYDHSGEQVIPAIHDPTGERYPNAEIHGNSVTEITIDFSLLYEQLPAGEYELFLIIEDNYDRNAVHPLMKNFYDRQNYTVQFQVK